MNPSYVGREILSSQEQRLVARSRIAQIGLLLVLAAMALLFLTFLAFDSAGSSQGELLFQGSIAALVLVGLVFIGRMTVGVWKDFRAKEKLVVKGKVVSVKARMSSTGMHYSICVGEKFIASDPLFSPVAGYLSRVQVGDTVVVSYLVHSRRTLSVVPAA
jgi:hypothetical protein